MATASPTSDTRPPSAATRPEVRTFWVGPQLSPYEELSLRSFVAAGARVFVYSPASDLRLPEGVELVDLNELLSGQVHQFTFADGDRSVALHSDLFRYAAVHKFGGWYVDLDVVLLRDALPDTKAYLARESPQLVNGAIMKFPARSPVLAAAIQQANELLPETRQGAPISARISIGPSLVTQLVQDYALDHLVRPRSSAYEITYDEIPAMFDPRMREELDARVADSDFVHLWNEIWRRVRIPKSYGPPAGSFLDGLFRRFGMDFSQEARLSPDTVAAWFHERQFLNSVAWQLGTEAIPENALDRLLRRPDGNVPHRASTRKQKHRRASGATSNAKAATPQTVRTLWQGGPVGPYQLLSLASFANRGHTVELFTFDTRVTVPDWIELKNAADILPAERVLRILPKEQRSAINGNLFRYALLHRLGGWWVDPDVVLLARELPGQQLFVSGPTEFGTISTAALKFTAAHPVLSDALVHSAPFDDAVEDWGQTGGPLLTRCLSAHHRLGELQPAETVSPVSWFDVASLFDPDQAGAVAEKLAKRPFLHLHYDAWLRAGIPPYLGPPPDCYLDTLFARHDLGLTFPVRMEFSDVRRWFAHMYGCLDLNPGQGRAPPSNGT